MFGRHRGLQPLHAAAVRKGADRFYNRSLQAVCTQRGAAACGQVLYERRSCCWWSCKAAGHADPCVRAQAALDLSAEQREQMLAHRYIKLASLARLVQERRDLQARLQVGPCTTLY